MKQYNWLHEKTDFGSKKNPQACTYSKTNYPNQNIFILELLLLSSPASLTHSVSLSLSLSLQEGSENFSIWLRCKWLIDIKRLYCFIYSSISSIFIYQTTRSKIKNLIVYYVNCKQPVLVLIVLKKTLTIYE